MKDEVGIYVLIMLKYVDTALVSPRAGVSPAGCRELFKVGEVGHHDDSARVHSILE